SENSDDNSAVQVKKKGGKISQDNLGRKNLHYEHTGYELLPSKLQEGDRNVAISTQTTHRNKKREKWHNEEQIHITVWKDTKPEEREIGEDTQGEAMGNWFKVTIPYGRKYDKAWLMNTVQSHCTVPFTPVDFHYIRNQARFFVQDVKTASALKDISYKICDEENQKISVFVNTSAIPYSMQNKFMPEQMEQLKLTMSKGYDASQQVLNLQKLRFDSGIADHSNPRADLVGHDIDMILNRRNCMFATLQIIESNFPELLSLNLQNNKLYQLDGLSDIIEKAPKVKILNLSKNELKTAKMLDKLKGLKLEELWLEGNPLCSTFPDQSAYVRRMQPWSSERTAGHALSSICVPQLCPQAIGGNCFLLGEKLGFPESRSQRWATASEQRPSQDRRGRQREKEGQKEEEEEEEAGAQAAQGHCCSLPHSTSHIQPRPSEQPW
ncbi:Hypothetical predicted protein, partial [Marmota monax]